jgi:hypothetical protein
MLKATCDLQNGLLKELMRDGEGLGEGGDSAANLAQIEWQEQVDALHASIGWLETKIMQECAELNAKDDSRAEL